VDAFELAHFGTVSAVQPRSFAAINDLAAEWSETSSRAKLARLCAAAIGLCWDHEETPDGPPRYNLAVADPIAYGGVILDWVYKKRIPLTQIYQVGSDLVLQLAAVIPNESEVAEAEDFSEAAPAVSTG
jgi:hypothetical protein